MSFEKLISSLLILSMLSACASIPEERNFDATKPIEKKTHFWTGTEYLQKGYRFPDDELKNYLANDAEAQSDFHKSTVYAAIGGLSALAAFGFLIASIAAPANKQWPLYWTGVSFLVPEWLFFHISNCYYEDAINIYNRRFEPKPTAYLLNYGWAF